MTDPRLKKLADVIVNYSVAIKPGDWVVIKGETLSAPMVKEIFHQVLLAGGHPNTLLGLSELNEDFYKSANEEQLKWVSPFQKLTYEKADVIIGLMGTTNTRILTNVDPQKISKFHAANSSLMKTYHKRSAEGTLRWVVSMFPCNAQAQEADMSLSEYEDFLYGATFVNKDDPVAEWQKLHKKQQVVVDWLKGKKYLTVKGPHVDLEMSIEGRLFENSDGKKNMPDGEIFTGPVEDSVDGWVEFTYPAIHIGHEVEDVRLVFKDGKVVEASASKNEETLISQLDVDAGARYVGEFAIGINHGIQKFTKHMLFDEKMGGTIHIALGASYMETGGQNESAIHWDMLCDMKTDSEIRVDGELLYQNGEFKIN